MAIRSPLRPGGSRRTPRKSNTAATMNGQTLARALDGFGRAYQLQTTVVWSVRGLAVGLLCGLIALVAARLIWGVILPFWMPLAPPLVGAMLGGVIAGLRAPQATWLAAAVDRKLGLHERTVTALELVGRSNDDSRTNVAMRMSLESEQVEDAIATLRRAEPLEAFPITVPRRDAIASVVVALAMVPMLFMGLPTRAVDTGPRLDELARGEAERISALADEIEREETAPDTNQPNEATAQLLRQIAEELRSPSLDADRAAAQLGDGERQLGGMQNANSMDTASALSRLADALDREQRTKPVSNALDRRDYKRAAEEARALGAKAANGSSADQQAIGDAMRRGSNSAARYDEKLAQALQEASERAERGENGATDAAANELDRAGNEMRRQETLERAMSQLQNSRQAISNAASKPGANQNANTRNQRGGQDPNASQNRESGNRAGEGAGTSQSQGQGQGQGQSQSPGQGQGEGQGQGQGQGQGEGQSRSPGQGQGSGAGTGSSPR